VEAPFDLPPEPVGRCCPNSPPTTPMGAGSCAWLRASMPFRTMTFGDLQCLKFLHTGVARPACLAAKSAIGLKALQHNLGQPDTLVLWGDSRFHVAADGHLTISARYGIHAVCSICRNATCHRP